MSAGVPPSKDALQRAHASLASARSAQIARVVAMVDAMPVRGTADTLIAPLRVRLAQLRPVRPYSFTRLLFAPLDPVILAPDHWQPGETGLPRHVLNLIGNAIQPILSELHAELAIGVASLRPDDRPAILAVGARLWPAAAEALAKMPTPPGWVERSSLPLSCFGDLTVATATILAEAVGIERLATSRTAVPDHALRAMFARADPRGRSALSTLTAVLLARLSATGQVLSIAAESSHRGIADEALAHTLARLEAIDPAENVDSSEAAVDASRVAALLAGMHDNAPPERRRRLEQVRHVASTLCLDRFERAASNALAQIATVTQGNAVATTDAAVAAIEAAARDLRRLETAGRKLGSADRYENRLTTLAGTVQQSTAAMSLADRVRLVEILCGPDAALELLCGPA